MDSGYEDIIKKCLKKDRRAEKELYDRLSGKLYAVCRRYCPCEDDALEMFQLGFIKLYNHLDQYSFNGPFEGWARRIMVNQCMDFYRKKHLTLVTDNPSKYAGAEEPSVFENEEDADGFPATAEQMMQFVDKLPEKYKLVFNLFVIEEYSHIEIAEQLNISVGTSKSNLSRAKAWLRNELKKNKINRFIA
ncbi:MAG: sigma-70 family RNA polymerase sigma factor [Weeksellaceae bacterium]|nr:sigma-70 family RNA polymerase sigma factor [Weeksellaceae bacterium]